jgi:hypothetical protein
MSCLRPQKGNDDDDGDDDDDDDDDDNDYSLLLPQIAPTQESHLDVPQAFVGVPVPQQHWMATSYNGTLECWHPRMSTCADEVCGQQHMPNC